MRSSVSDQPCGPKRCWTAISTLWQITQRMTSSQPGVFGISTSCAPAPKTKDTATSAAASARLRHIHLDGVDHVPAIAQAIERAAGGLHAAEAVGGARHDRVAAGGGVPRVFPLAPGVAVPVAGELAGGPRLAAIGGDVAASQITLAGPSPAPGGHAAGLKLGALGRAHDDGLHLERLQRVDLLVVVHARRRVVGLHVEAVELIR